MGRGYRSNSHGTVDDIENEICSEAEAEAEAGDIGDRALQSNRNSQNGTPNLSFDQTPENRVALPILDYTLFQPYEISSTAMNASSPVSVDPKVQAEDQKVKIHELFFYIFFLHFFS